MTVANEARPADYAPLTRPGHNAETVLEVEGLHTYLFTRLGVVKAVDRHQTSAGLDEPPESAARPTRSATSARSSGSSTLNQSAPVWR